MVDKSQRGTKSTRIEKKGPAPLNKKSLSMTMANNSSLLKKYEETKLY